MALEIGLWLLVVALGLITYFLGVTLRTQFLFLFGCVSIFGAGALLFAFNGLIMGYYYTELGALASIIVDSSNIGVLLLSFVFVGWGLISALVFDFTSTTKSKNPFHY